jgi:hypothetical protein
MQSSNRLHATIRSFPIQANWSRTISDFEDAPLNGRTQECTATGRCWFLSLRDPKAKKDRERFLAVMQGGVIEAGRDEPDGGAGM